MEKYIDEEITPPGDGYFWVKNRETGERLPGERRDGMLVFRAAEDTVALVIDGKGLVLTLDRALTLQGMLGNAICKDSL